jgi:hypothetical protein
MIAKDLKIKAVTLRTHLNKNSARLTERGVLVTLSEKFGVAIDDLVEDLNERIQKAKNKDSSTV